MANGAAALKVPTQQQCCMGTQSSTVLPVTTAPGERPCHVPCVNLLSQRGVPLSSIATPCVCDLQQVVLALLPASQPCSTRRVRPQAPHTRAAREPMTSHKLILGALHVHVLSLGDSWSAQAWYKGDRSCCWGACRCGWSAHWPTWWCFSPGWAKYFAAVGLRCSFLGACDSWSPG